VNNIQLTINISRTSVQVAEVLRSSQEVVSNHYMRFKGATPINYKEELKSFFDGLSLKDEYEEYTMSWCSLKYGLIPMRVYNDSSPQKIMELLFGDTIEKENSDFNRLAELNIVNVYEIPDWVKSFFIIKFPQLIFKHEHAMTLRALFQGSTYKLKTIVSVCDNYINVSIIQKNELVFSNAFEYLNAEDIVYHLMFVLEQKEFKEEKGTLQFIFQNEESQAFTNKAIDLLKETKMIKSHSILESENSSKLQLLCV
jgi:hypothetical protein